MQNFSGKLKPDHSCSYTTRFAQVLRHVCIDSFRARSCYRLSLQSRKGRLKYKEALPSLKRDILELLGEQGSCEKAIITTGHVCSMGGKRARWAARMLDGHTTHFQDKIFGWGSELCKGESHRLSNCVFWTFRPNLYQMSS